MNLLSVLHYFYPNTGFMAFFLITGELRLDFDGVFGAAAAFAGGLVVASGLAVVASSAHKDRDTNMVNMVKIRIRFMAVNWCVFSTLMN